MPRWNSLNFQDSRSISMLELTILHDYVIIVIIRVLLLIFYILFIIILSKNLYKTFSERTLIETIWSLVPAFILILLILPSIKVLYIVEDIKNPEITLKIIAHQWYWSYINPLFLNLFYSINKNNQTNNIEYDSLLRTKTPRLLNRTSRLILPSLLTSRFLITSTDVIHSFAIPTLGLKVDALPGRINQLYRIPTQVGLYFGQCSEICGSNHSFIPISLLVCNITQYDKISLLNTLEKLNLG